MSFRVIAPSGPRIPVVVEVPHASLRVDAESLAWLIAPSRSLGRDADLFVDELYADAPRFGATLLIGEINRYVCDLNRGPDDVDALSLRGGVGNSAPHGLVWRRTTDGHPALSDPIPEDELERRVSTYHRPYHDKLEELLEARREEFGYAILICAHSMPSRGRSASAHTLTRRADVVPGSRGGTSAAANIVKVADVVASRFGLSLRHDDPYRGGYSTGKYGTPSRCRHALQIELSRATYMDESRLVPHAGFARMQAFCAALVEEMGVTVPADDIGCSFSCQRPVAP